MREDSDERMNRIFRFDLVGPAAFRRLAQERRGDDRTDAKVFVGHPSILLLTFDYPRARARSATSHSAHDAPEKVARALICAGRFRIAHALALGRRSRQLPATHKLKIIL